MTKPLLAVDDLRVHFEGAERVQAVDGLSFDIERGETVCIVGESGSGKTVTCETITGLVPSPPAVTSGAVRFDGRNLLPLADPALRSIRGNRIAHVFQNPKGALDPVYTVGDQIAEAITLHRDVSDEAARQRAVELLRRVEIPRPHERVDDYPHQFSDGMCQRVAIAIALAAEPDLLIADEPTSALDVTIQARIIDLLDRLLSEEELTLLLVTHDLRVVSTLADRVIVLYDGVDVERGTVERVFERPAHPYTQSLIENFVGHTSQTDGTRPSPAASGCRFRTECPHAIETCEDGRPPLYRVEERPDHETACVHYGPEGDASTVLADAAGIGDSKERTHERD